MKGQTNAWLLSTRARELRRAMTDAERRLWRGLRHGALGVKFRRQHPFEDFVLDFVSLEARLVIELEGGQHAERSESDEARTRRLEEARYRVLRFWNDQVLTQTEAVLDVIARALTPLGLPAGRPSSFPTISR
jgi:very-short-patch-repair endonuclease